MTITIESGIMIEPGIIIGTVPIVKPGVNRTVTANGNAQISTNVVKFGTGSYTSNQLSGLLKVTPTTGLALGTGDFTLECWYYPGVFPADISIVMGFRPLNTQGFYPTIVIQSGGRPSYYTNVAYRVTGDTGTLTLNQWNSIAIVRSNGVTKLYANGVQTGGDYSDNNNYLAGSCIVGASDFQQTGVYPIRGYLDEVRISNIARYTANYTPATQPFVTDQNTLLLLHCDGTDGSTTFTDSSNTV